MSPAIHDPRERAKRSLLGVADLTDEEILFLLQRASQREPLLNTPAQKSTTLKGRSLLLLFFENSTRTRTSFELAGKLLSADVVNFSAASSSLNKGESIRDTVETATMMGFDGIVVRHQSSGMPWRMQQWSTATLINGGDGAHQHPTQALLDALTLQQTFRTTDFSGMRIGIVGDITHSRVSRSVTELFARLGANVTFVAPPTLLPADVSYWRDRYEVTVSTDLDASINEFDVIYTIRPQKERITEALIPYTAEYINRYGLSEARIAKAKPEVVILEAGPLVRGVQMSDAVADSPINLMNRQVRNGAAVRMAVLEWLLGDEQ